MRWKRWLGAICFTVSFFVSQAQRNDFDRRWAMVDSLMYRAGLAESALTTINRIYEQALKEHNSAEEIKALIYRIAIEQENTDDDTAAIRAMEGLVARSVQPARSILQTLLANQYWKYLQQHRWRFYQRSTVESGSDPDFTTWTVEHFHRHIRELFLTALRDQDMLERSSLKDWQPIRIKGNTPGLRPTLFDLLAQEALDYFKNSESAVIQPEQAFEIDDPAIFAEANLFARHVFIPADSSSPQYQAILLYQRLIKFHLSDPNPAALIDVDLDRLDFARNYSVGSDKEDEYLQALTRLTGKWGSQPAAAQAWYLQAKHFSDLATAPEEQGDTSRSQEQSRAVSICEQVLKEADSSAGKPACRVLLHDIVRPRLDLTAEEFNIPEKPFRCLVRWANVKRMYFRIGRLNPPSEKVPFEQSDEEWEQWLRAPVSREFVRELPETVDHLQHSAEIPIGPLPPGNYVLLCSADTAWNIKHDAVSGEKIYVTSMAYIGEETDYFFVNRESGQPITDARIQVWTKGWTNQGRYWEMSRGQSYHPDEDGHVSFNPDNAVTQQFFELERPGEDIFLTDLAVGLRAGLPGWSVTADRTTYEQGNALVYFFLDRSIYRPGQPLYFKGISITRDFETRQMKPMPGREAKIILLNANNERVDSIKLVTDEFGAYHGVFHLPMHGLNGRFRIEDELGHGFTREFSVEEYKRPRFYVKFDQLRGSYRVGDTLSVSGTAVNYSGNDLDGATVKYQITRLARFPGYLRSAWEWFPRNGQHIAHGELKSGAHGEFQVQFVARPDRTVPASADPRFEYRIDAEVTDINGETRSGTTTVVAGYAVLDAEIGLVRDEAIPADSLRSIRVDIKNLSGEVVPAPVEIAAYPLKGPTRLIRQRLWDAPDRWVMAESAFLDSFPHDEYRKELDKENWPRGPVAWEGLDSTGGHALRLRLKPGWWVIEATATDSFGHQVKDRRYVELLENTTGAPVDPEYIWGGGRLTETVAEPGDAVRIGTGSSAANVHVVRAIMKAEETYSMWRRENEIPASPVFEHFSINVGSHDTESKVTEAERGGINVADAFVRDNRVYVHRTTVEVPWDNQTLQIHYISFRDRTDPGSGENWSVGISGQKGERVTAQVLASMYDASLDQFAPHSWNVPDLYPRVSANMLWEDINDFRVSWPSFRGQREAEEQIPSKEYDRLLPADMSNFNIPRKAGGFVAAVRHFKVTYQPAATISYRNGILERNLVYDRQPVVMKSVGIPGDAALATAPPPTQIRSNFQETAFFFPDLRTDSAGNVSFSFTMPEALTRWKWMTLANTKDLAFGYSEKSIVTQKQLMVQPNMPRFLREGDKVNLAVKVVNLTDSEMTGQMSLALTDPTTGQTADGWFINRQPNQYFTVPARGSFVVEFPIDIPYQYNRPLTYRVEAQAGNYSDGEQATLPVVSNRMMVTETLPIDMAADGTRTFKFNKLLESGRSETLNHHLLTVEFTANPSWYAVQALPYLMEFPHECAEQKFDRLYANALATKIVRSSPRIAQVFQRWRTVDTAALLSNLEKDLEVKSVLLEETPWVLEGKTESQQRRNIALLFDTARMSRELGSTIGQLAEMQTPDGGFPWFIGGREDRFVTQYILTGFGRLERLQALPAALQGRIDKIIAAAIPYTDREIREEYAKDRKARGGIHAIEPFPAQYLYMRSFFAGQGIPGDVFPAVNFYRKLAQQDWPAASKFIQGMVALALYRTGDVETSHHILASLRETAIHDPELGMYWKGMEGGYYWWQAPVEMESLLIETFREVGADPVADRGMKTWLLRQKQTHQWPTTKATADAVYALLLGGQDWVNQERRITVKLGDKTLDLTGGESGTGYNKKIIDAPFLDSAMGNISVTMKTAERAAPANGAVGSAPKANSGSPAWGAVYWQYFDQLDQITTAHPGGAKSPLHVTKRLYIQRSTDRGPVLDTIPDNGTIHVGDRVVVRVELRSDRDLEYVHLKDMRASCLEPVNVLSGYRWQGGLGFYESTKDASTEFFFSSVPRGTYVFEYPLVAEQTGEYSNGLASVECMYAPEFADHTEGIRINVEGAP